MVELKPLWCMLKGELTVQQSYRKSLCLFWVIPWPHQWCNPAHNHCQFWPRSLSLWDLLFQQYCRAWPKLSTEEWVKNCKDVLQWAKLLTSSMNNRTFLSRPPPANSNPQGSFSFSRVKFTVTNSVSEGILKAEKCKELCSLWQKAKKYFFNQLKNYVKSNLSNLEGWWNYLWYNDNAKSPKKWCYSCPKSWLNRRSRSWVLSQ